MEFNKPFSLPAVLRAESSAAEDENHWVQSLQFGELPMFCGLIGKLIVGKDCPGNNVRSHDTPFLLEHHLSSLFCKNLRGLVSLKFWIEEKVDSGGVTRSAEPIGSARRAPRTDPQNTVSRARPFRCGIP